MVFALITFLTALLIEGIGTYISILGLSALFAFNPIIIAMAIALDIGKLVAVSFVYKHWAKINWAMKAYMTVAAAVLMLITSVGAFGFLSAEFQKAIAGSNQQGVRIEALMEEKARLLARKEQIDQQVANLPANYARARVNVINAFKEEAAKINERLAQIDEELPRLKVESIERSMKVGPILYIAQAFNTTPEVAVKWVILTIIFVFDPLAIVLILAGNFLLEQREQGRQPVTQQLRAPAASRAPRPPRPARVAPESPRPAPAPEPPQRAQAPTPPRPPQAPRPSKLTVEENPTGRDIVKVKDPVVTSSLERIDARRADVLPETDTRHRVNADKITSAYAPGPGVKVGGPPTKIYR